MAMGFIAVFDDITILLVASGIVTYCVQQLDDSLDIFLGIIVGFILSSLAIAAWNILKIGKRLRYE